MGADLALAGLDVERAGHERDAVHESIRLVAEPEDEPARLQRGEPDHALVDLDAFAAVETHERLEHASELHEALGLVVVEGAHEVKFGEVRPPVGGDVAAVPPRQHPLHQ